MIQFKNFDFHYNSNKSLHKNINLNLASDKIYGLFGKNGTGKTTLLKAIVGLVYPTSGEVKVGEYTPKDRLPPFLSDIYYVSDELTLPKLSIKKYVQLFSSYYNNFSKSDFEKYLTDFELPLEGKPYEFSLGQQKKILISFAVACNTSYLVMDESRNGLDIPSKIVFRKLLISTMNENKTVFISTHQAKDLEQLLDHIIILHQDSIILNNSIQEIGEKLSFRHYETEPEKNSYINSQKTLGGYRVVEENIENEPTKIYTEQLMIAAVENPERIKKLFLN